MPLARQQRRVFDAFDEGLLRDRLMFAIHRETIR